METLRQDVALAIRFLRKTPGFTIPAVLTLALGIGANTTIFALTDALLFRRLPVPDADRIVHIYQTRPDRPPNPFPVSLADYFEYRDRSRSFDVLAAHYPTSPMHVIVDGEPLAITGAVVTANYFDVLQLRPWLGRFFLPAEDQARDRDAVVVVSHGMWQRRFGGGPDAIGRTIQINGRAFLIVGVAPQGFTGVRGRGDQTDAWIPSAMFTTGYRYCDAFSRGCTIVQMLGRLKQGIAIREAQSELDVIAAGVAAAFPENKGLGVRIVEARGLGLATVTDEIRQLRLFLLVVGVVLLMACANVAGLLMTRASARRKEFAMRLALGATRRRLVRQLFTETAVLAAIGSIAGLIVAAWGNGLLESIYSFDTAGRPLDFPLIISANVFAATALIAVGATFAIGLIPALTAGRSDVVVALKDESGAGGGRRSATRLVLVTAQIGASVLLLIGAGLLLQSVWHLNRGANFDPDHVAVFRLRPSLVDYSRDRSHAFQRRAIEAIQAVPGVVSASPSVFFNLLGAGALARVSVDATTPADLRQETLLGHGGAKYFETVGVPLVEGRDFSDRDTLDAPRVTILNEVIASRLFGSSPAVGNTLYVNGQPHDIIGVARDAQFYAAGEAPRAQIFLSYWQPLNADAFANDARMMVRVNGDPGPMMDSIRRAITAVDPNVPIAEDAPLRDRVRYNYQGVHLARTMMVGFAILAVALSAVGVYGVLAFSVAQRTREMAIRFALGATRGEVARLVLRDAAIMTTVGLALGVTAAWSSSRFLGSFLYGLDPNDAGAFVAGPLVLIAVAVIASAVPARRAADVSASAALRYE
jgi:putative ABC transport system permease protein